MEIGTKSSRSILDQFIPELFFDYFFISKGKVKVSSSTRERNFFLPQQGLRTIYTRPTTFIYSTPCVLLGARFSLRFAESFWEKDIPSNSFLPQSWVEENTIDLESFKRHVIEYVQKHKTRRTPYPMLKHELDESDWLVNFSPRHKRRLYKTIFGTSKKELQNIHNVHSFLDQACDFSSENPRIIQYVNAEIFYDQPHLNHAFKKMTGLSPVEYFEANSILQDNLMSASYNEIPVEEDTL
jgi:hypothetical protein